MGTIYLIRHGQASFEADDYDQLSALGFQQAIALGQHFAQRKLQPTHIFSGSLKRHQQTAEHCLQAMDQAAQWQELKGLNEYNHQEIIVRHTPRYADAQVMREEMQRQENPWRSFQKFYSQAMLRWMRDEHACDYQEPWAQFRERCLAALDQIYQATQHKQSTLVFSSGGAISAMCQQLLGLDDHHTLQLSWQLVNTGVCQLQCGQQRPRLSVLNEHSHLHQQQEITYR